MEWVSHCCESPGLLLAVADPGTLPAVLTYTIICSLRGKLLSHAASMTVPPRKSNVCWAHARGERLGSATREPGKAARECGGFSFVVKDRGEHTLYPSWQFLISDIFTRPWPLRRLLLCFFKWESCAFVSMRRIRAGDNSAQHGERGALWKVCWSRCGPGAGLISAPAIDRISLLFLRLKSRHTAGHVAGTAMCLLVVRMK